ncbi:hypothetical protein NTGZN8_320003 [Candidatus Nitrotoga fabula]|uniref:Uncharacterized protein n=1 Tax=Candidatus Nitrotoga fabula TaxID=2182327 RepID=A0A916BDS9_9PROT|nr:hypothetical protein NTGZN8_320003 [Candidatus Nitrotoga fabula]
MYREMWKTDSLEDYLGLALNFCQEAQSTDYPLPTTYLLQQKGYRQEFISSKTKNGNDKRCR